MTKLFVEDFTLITKRENNYYSEFEDEFFNEIIPNKNIKILNFLLQRQQGI